MVLMGTIQQYTVHTLLHSGMRCWFAHLRAASVCCLVMVSFCCAFGLCSNGWGGVVRQLDGWILSHAVRMENEGGCMLQRIALWHIGCASVPRAAELGVPSVDEGT